MANSSWALALERCSGDYRLALWLYPEGWLGLLFFHLFSLLSLLLSAHLPGSLLCQAVTGRDSVGSGNDTPRSLRAE